MKFPRAEWRGPVPGHSPGPITPRLVVVHIAQGSLAGTDAWFKDPASRLSAHFGTGKDGRLVQWVDATDKAWAEAAYNSQAISIENEGHSGDSLTAAQVEQCAQVLAWTYSTFGVPIQVAPTAAADGLIGHGQLGATGGNHPGCPGGPIVAQFAEIVDRAAVIAGRPSPAPPSPTPVPNPQPQPVVEDDMPVAFDPINGDFWVLTGADGGVDARRADGSGSRRFYGNLIDHPEYNAGVGKPLGPAIGIGYWPAGQPVAGEPAGGYVIVTRAPDGSYHPYHFDASTLVVA